MSEIERSTHEENVASLVSYFENGIKSKCDNIGIELEHTIVKLDGSPVSYSEPEGVAFILGKLQADYPIPTWSDHDLIGVSRPHEAITIEPAAQIELSAGPFENLKQADECFSSFETTLEKILQPLGAQALTIGYHPTSRARDLELIPKQRYQYMNEHFAHIGPFGACMMRGSASTQVSIDYHSVEDCLRKMRLACALVPFFSLVSDNAPIFEGKPRTHRMVRTEIWTHCDPARCGIVPGIMNPDFTLRDYAEFLLRTPAILAPNERGELIADARTFDEIYGQRPMKKADIEHALSMIFTDVRLKTYVEIRPADALPIPHAIAYAAFVKGLMLPERSLDALDRLFADATEEDIAQAKHNLMTQGYEGLAYGRPAFETLEELIAIARENLSCEDCRYLESLALLIEKRTTLAEQSAQH